MPSELDVLKANYSRYMREKERLLAEATKAEELAEAARTLIQAQGGKVEGLKHVEPEPEAHKPKIPYTPLLNEFINTGPWPEGFKIADARRYIEAKGYKTDRRTMDSAITETCNRSVNKGKLEKRGPLYYLKEIIDGSSGEDVGSAS